MSNMVVQTNVLALNTHRNMKTIGQATQKASARLSSGYKINNAADDAAGLAISEKMRAQIRGLDMASKNAQDAQSLVNTAEGGLQEITNMTQRIRELTVQAGNDTNSTTDTKLISQEVGQLLDEINTRSSQVEFNTKKLLDGSFSGTFQIGPNQGHTVSISIGSVGSADAGCGFESTDVSSPADAKLALDSLDSGLTYVAEQRAKLGAMSNRLDYVMKSLDVTSENLSDAESRIRNADMAKEMMNYTKSNVLQQAAVSMLSQANSQPQNLLSLLR